MGTLLYRLAKKNSTLLINAGSLVGTTGVTSILGFAYWWIAARQFSPGAVGLASAAISAMTLLGSFGVLGLGTLLIGELPHQRGKEASLISATLIVVGVVGGCLGIIFAVIAPFLSHDFQELRGSVENVVLFALGVSFTSITSVLDRALIGLLRGGLQLWRNALFAATKLTALFVASLWLSHATGLTIYVTWLIGNALSLAVLGGYSLLKSTSRSYLPQWGLLRKLGPTALRHHALNLTLDAPVLILPVLVTILLSATTNAWFYVSWNISSIANIITAIFTTMLFAVTSARPDEFASKLRLTLSLSLVTTALANCVLLFGTKEVLSLFGHSYAEQAAWSLRILAIESFPFIIKSHYIAVSRIQGQVVSATLFTIVSGSLELGGAALGAWLGGLSGLSIGWFAAVSFEAIFMCPVVFKALKPDVSNKTVPLLRRQ